MHIGSRGLESIISKMHFPPAHFRLTSVEQTTEATQLDYDNNFTHYGFMVLKNRLCRYVCRVPDKERQTAIHTEHNVERKEHQQIYGLKIKT